MKKILLIALPLLVFFSSAKSQVIFTDIHPDVTLNQITPGQIAFIIDMTNDGDTDFQIINSYSIAGDSTYSQTYVIADSGNAVAVDAQHLPLALTADTMVNSSLHWDSLNFGPLKKVISAFGNISSFAGNWIDATDRFLGVRFRENDTLKYGWIEMVMNTNQVSVVTTILDYAFENSGAGILTQDSLGAIGIEDIHQPGSLSIFVFNNIAIVKCNSSLNIPLQISVTDLFGREEKVFTTQESEVTIDLSTRVGNMFIVSARQGNEIVRKKILVM